MDSLNPLRYRPAQIAKALVALLTCVIGLCGVCTTLFTTGTLAALGESAAAAALFLTPILVFLQKAEPVLEDWQLPAAGSGREDPSDGTGGAHRATAGD